MPQTTGEWFPSFRRSLLGGKSLNRFSSFVTTGAEEFVLQGSSSDTSVPHPPRVPSDFEEDVKRASVLGHLAEAERHYVEAGPSWRAKVPPFHVLVHSPNKRTSTLSGAFTVYAVTSVFGVLSHSRSSSDASDPGADEDQDEEPPEPMRITVHRRFSHFVALHTALTRLLPGIALPPLPEKQYAGRFSDDFVEARRGDLERYINRVARHPVARYAEVLTFFLGCESDVVSEVYAVFGPVLINCACRSGRSSCRTISRFLLKAHHSSRTCTTPPSTSTRMKRPRQSTGS